MSVAELLFTALAAVGMALALAVVHAPRPTGGRWHALIVLALAVYPALVTFAGARAQLAHTKTTTFCLSCHVMAPYGEGLSTRDEPRSLAAAHFQDRLVDRQHACYACHRDYTVFGGTADKVRGLRHVWANYARPQPAEITLYAPFPIATCLHCHDGARSFEEHPAHAGMLDALRDGSVPCFGCHGPGHREAS